MIIGIGKMQPEKKSGGYESMLDVNFYDQMKFENSTMFRVRVYYPHLIKARA